ncbi:MULTISPECIES: phosphate-starvation-inducible PsiE family protein [Staphylococcus]|uniref:phosphate-starvation-inducible PsiE family protein n=1 Tax=Staphylococcus TaxID=1279 RepID=UPI000D1C4035|nr:MULTISPECIES: phosphate-starvation-inducible PsiE family protein [Staphylococcus]MBA1354876.1 phosphate-starvation-inducible protein PsiE [Staphylococcus cohnii]MBA1392273.1 phosphate-starvation-inducible protein PsiE [Staphylococcus cohnii]MBZ8172203.1 phosphate-starvation-inducible protein PsiE [Staphylococcus cohnii]PTF01397.1 phosphate-starvation-inducible protein PsiE [Staphylococcus cohnii]
MNEFNEKVVGYFTKLLFLLLNLCIALLAIILIVFLFKEIIEMINSFLINKTVKYNYVVEKMLVAFMHIEFIILIIQYFKRNYHFSLQFFIYVGITAVIRFIIVEHYNAIETMILSLTIVVLIVALYLLKKTSLD